jgi:hypothetical protein
MSSAIDRGVFCVARRVFDAGDPLFGDEPYSKRDAWLWLVSQAAYQPRTIQVKERRGLRSINLERGQMSFSRSYLMAAWSWSSEKAVRSYLDSLENLGRIVRNRGQQTGQQTGQQKDDVSGQQKGQQKGQQQSVITICKYEDYQFPIQSEGQQKGQQTGQQNDDDGASKRAAERPESKKDNKSKKESIGRFLGFEEWYPLWPRKRQPDAARRAYNRVIASGRIDHAGLLAKTKAFVTEWSRSKQDLKFCPYPAKWLGDGGFDDEISVAAPGSSPVRDPSTFSDAEWQQRVANFKANGDWSRNWGSAPGKPGCLVPRHLLVVSAMGAA